jgi:carboxymethylenebutenolidase
MNEFHVDVETPDGTMECFAAHPDGDGPFPAVILYMDAPGIREELRDFCRRIADQGYFALLPDMYWREGKMRFDLSKGQAVLDKMFASMDAIDLGMVMRDTKGMLDYLDANPVVGGPTGCIGYCMSGQYVVAAAGTYPDHFKAMASLYGVGIVTDHDRSPHLLASEIKAELYLGFAEEDPWVGDDVIPTLTEELDDYSVNYTLESHPGTEHGFCFPGRPAYNEAAAEKVWGIFFDLCERNLKS